MLWAVVVPVAVWWMLRKERAYTRLPVVVLVAMLTVAASGGLGTIWPILELPADSQATTTVFAPACFPFTIARFHDFSARLFNYRIVLGWPNGIPAVVLPTEDDQSEFMHIQAFTCAAILIQLAFLAALAGLAAVLAIETGETLRKRFVSRNLTPSKHNVDRTPLNLMSSG
jgi:hypothetical protein